MDGNLSGTAPLSVLQSDPYQDSKSNNRNHRQILVLVLEYGPFWAKIFLHHTTFVMLKRTHVWAATRLPEPLPQTFASIAVLRQTSTQGLATMDRNGVVKYQIKLFEMDSIGGWALHRATLLLASEVSKGVGGHKGLARGDPSYARDLGLFLYPFSYAPLGEGGHNSGEQFWLYVGPRRQGNLAAHTP